MPATERREHLKQYILGCVRDNVLSWNDLLSPDIVHKLLGALSKDGKTVVGELLRTGGGNLLRFAGMAVAGFAEDVAAGRRKTSKRHR
jgi:hypothetical protein